MRILEINVTNGEKTERAPTDSEIADFHATSNLHKPRSYKDKRADEYPPIGDQLDAIMKQLNYERMNGRELVQEMDDILGKVLEVKRSYPKPGGNNA